MTNLLLENGNDGFNVMTFILLGAIVLMMVVMMIMRSRQQRQMVAHRETMQDKMRPGMRVKTAGGCIGRIKEIRQEDETTKTVLIETGYGNNVSYQLFDVNAIISFIDEPTSTMTPTHSTPLTPATTDSPSTDFDAGSFVKESNKSRKK
ncbi:MAG: preprotein translocase subunit YajC [Firmicutes bacterium]|nr:preprotein translocase subunit YajC [Bacillota bacterium]